MTQTRYYTNAAVATTVVGALNNTDTASTFVVTAATGYPSLPFTAVVDSGTSNEEIVLVTGVTGTTVTATRGSHGTTKHSHLAGASFKHCASAQDFTDANIHINAAAAAAHDGVLPALKGTSIGDTVGIRFGTFSDTTDSSGVLVVTHGLGATPTGVSVNSITASTYIGAVTSIGATTFTIKVWATSAANTPLNAGAIAGSFIAWVAS